MHSLVRRYIKTAIGFLFVGLVLGSWMTIEREFYGRAVGSYEVSAHTHAILVGFVMMMILGVALWLFPRPERDDRRYRPGLAAAAYWLITAGTAARVAGELLHAPFDSPLLRAVIVAGALAQVAGIALFFFTMWSRIRALGSRVREEAGERF